MNMIKPVYDTKYFMIDGTVRISIDPNNALTMENGVIKLKDVEATASKNTPGDGVYGTLGEGIQTLRLNTSVPRKMSGDLPPSSDGVNETILVTEFITKNPPPNNGGGN